MTLFLMLVNTVQSWELIGFCMVVGSIYRTRTYTQDLVILYYQYDALLIFFFQDFNSLSYTIRHHDTPSFTTFHSRSNVQKIHSVQMTNSNQSLIKPHNKIKSRIEQTLYFLLNSSNSLCSKLSTYTLQNLILCVVEKMQNSCHENWCTCLLFYVLKQRIVQSLMAWGGCTKRSVLKFSSSLFFV